MARSYHSIVDKLKPIQEKVPNRFKRFYDQVFLLLQSIPEGKSILVREHCTARSLEMFVDVAELCIIESMAHRGKDDSWLEFTEDRKEIRRVAPFRPSKYSISR